MKLSVIIPTYNREKLLAQTLQSLADAQIPPNLTVEVIVVNNNSTDQTQTVIEQFTAQSQKFELTSIFESKQGRSAAVNAGIRQVKSELISMIDDDIQINPDWFVEVEKIFRERADEIDFVGGKVLPIFEIEPPEWVLEIKDVGICWRDYGEEEWWYGKDTPILTGGHAVFKTEVFQEIGLYSEELGVKKRNLLSCEDDVMFDKLLDSGKRGIYLPKLLVFHYVPAIRLTKNFYRQWYFGAGMSWNLMDIHYKPYLGVKIFRVPRYLYRNALISLKNNLKYLLGKQKIKRLETEKNLLLFAGFFYSRNLQNSWFDKPLKVITEKLLSSASR